MSGDRRLTVRSVVFVLGLVAAACGSGTKSPASSEPSPTVPVTAAETIPPTDPTVDTTPAPITDAPGPAPIEDLAGVRDAVVQIVGTGTFADPFGGVQANVPGSGSGFIIDESGLAVTNNHVVTGAALLEVYISGEDRPRNARVVAASECSDLAVIDIDGDGFRSLGWYDGPLTAGLSVYAAGFPLGDAEYTVLDGIVSKERATGETAWASVDAVIEHSADTLPGSSGGPIVDDEGRVVAINYAGNDVGQSFAIGLDVARPVVELLAAGTDVETIGINGEAVYDGTSSGIWVYSVQSGSPADVAGVRAGDLLVTMEGLELATDGTMSDYCDVLRSHDSAATLTIEVYRGGTDELLEGQLNGRPLQVATSFETQLDDALAEDPTAGGAADDPVDDPVDEVEYMMVTDDSELIAVSVPIGWSDLDGRLWDSDLVPGEELIGPALSASPDLEAYVTGWGTPGVFIGASPLIPTSLEESLDSFWFGDDCSYDGRYDYDDGAYTGRYDVYTDCGPEGSVFVQLFAEPPDGSWLAMVQMILVTEADLAAADRIFATFTVQPLGG